MAFPDESLPPPGWGSRGLDHLLAAFASGQLSEIVGPRSSGASSLLLALVARASASGAEVALVDGADQFDAASAVVAGADLTRVLWIRCGGRLRAAFGAADLLARCPGFALVALDLGESTHARRVPPAFFLRLKLAAEQGATRLVLRLPQHLAGSAAALAVSMRRLQSGWSGTPRPTRLAGLTSEARVIRSRTRSAVREGEGVVIAWRL